LRKEREGKGREERTMNECKAELGEVEVYYRLRLSYASEDGWRRRPVSCHTCMYM
jgi:hypothetical protein